VLLLGSGTLAACLFKPPPRASPPSLGDCPLFDEEQPCLELLEGRLAELEAEA